MSARLADAAERDRVAHPRLLLLGERLGHRARHHAGRHHVHRDAARGDFLGERFGHADHAGLRGGVIRLAGIADRADHARDRDDAPAAPPHHAAQRRAGEPERRGEIDIEHALPVLVLEAERQHVARQAGIVDQDGERPRRLLRRSDQRVRRRGVGEVGGADMGALAEFAGQRIERLAPRAGERDRRALAVQRARDRRADAARGAGHQRRLAVQSEHRRLLRVP